MGLGEIEVGLGDDPEDAFAPDEEVYGIHAVLGKHPRGVLDIPVVVVGREDDLPPAVRKGKHESPAFRPYIPAFYIQDASVRKYDTDPPDPLPGRTVPESPRAGCVSGYVPSEGTVELRRIHGIEELPLLRGQHLRRPLGHGRYRSGSPPAYEFVELTDGDARLYPYEIPAGILPDAYDLVHPFHGQDISPIWYGTGAHPGPHTGYGEGCAVRGGHTDRLYHVRLVLRHQQPLGVAPYLRFVHKVVGVGTDLDLVQHMNRSASVSWPR